MKWFRKHSLWVAMGVVLLGVAATRGALIPGGEDVVAGSELESALYRIMGLPDGTVVHSRPPWEAKKHVGDLIAQAPQDGALYVLRARQEESLQQYGEAEEDWKAAAEKSQDKLAARLELAEFYARRNQPKQQVDALLSAAAFAENQAGKQYADALDSAQRAQLPAAEERAIYGAWLAQFPKQREPYQSYLSWLLSHKDKAGATALAARMHAAFPEDQQLAITTEASLARMAAGDSAALAVYDRSFSPLWPEPLRREYFNELTAAHRLRLFLGQAQQAAAAHPTDLAPIGRIFFYYELTDRKPAADQALLAFEGRRAASNLPWTVAELKTCGELFGRAQDWDESAHSFYVLYGLSNASAGDREYALAQLINLLLDVPEQPLSFGSRDLSLYRNMATMDRHPGFLNGILTMALQGAEPEQAYQTASQSASVYFHRASASRLIGYMQQQFPHSRRLSDLQAKLFEAYQSYGQQEALVRLVPTWLAHNHSSPAYVDVALMLADAYATRNNTAAEIRLYDQLLIELAAKSKHVPIGASAEIQDRNEAPQPPPRSAGYARVLDRDVSRLVQLQKPLDALAALRREIDRNPDDPGIYQRLTLFVEQTRMDGELEQTYKAAFAHFNDASWGSKLARFYLRFERYEDYEALMRHVIETFKGSAVGPFLNGAAPSTAQLSLRLNLYAHQRFPHNMAFVHNLLIAYEMNGTSDPRAKEALLRENWFYDSSLRDEYFAELNQTGKLRDALKALPPLEQATKDSNVAALQFSAYGHAWLTDYEGGAPFFAKLADLEPGEAESNRDAIAIERSVGYASNTAFSAAIHFAQQDVNALPASRENLIRVGEIYADREEYSKAKPWWNRASALQPGSEDGYLDSATVFWDYFQFADALDVIANARQKLHDPWKFSYETGAVYESESKLHEAILAYIAGALHDGCENCQTRLLRLSTRAATADLVEKESSKAVSGAFDDRAFQLRCAILEGQERRLETEKFLSEELGKAAGLDELQTVESAADRLHFESVAASGLQRLVQATVDPIEKLRAQLELGHFYESHNDHATAERTFAAAYSEAPERLGVLRALVDYYWRNKQADKAVGALTAAATGARPPYGVQLLREAAGKAADSGAYGTARTLLDQLLVADPWNGDLLAQKAHTFASEGNQKGLLDFYGTELAALKASALSGSDKSTRMGALRRGYLAALVAAEANADALEQYQLLINSYPEDSQLIMEVAQFADDHQMTGRLVSYYTKAVADAPRDYRWPIVLARIDADLRRYPEAITAYAKAAVVRPDRADIFTAKADLEKRLLRFDDAFATYGKLYELSYHDTQYLVAQADLKMRLGKAEEALKLLQAAYVESRPGEPAGYLLVMQQEAAWRNFAAVERVFTQARDVLARSDADRSEAVRVDAEALTALHKPQDAVEMAGSALPSSSPTSAVVAAIGTAATGYLTPSDKAAFVDYLEHGRVPPRLQARTLAEACRFEELVSKFGYQAALSKNPARDDWEALQQTRLKFEELGQELEAVAAKQATAEQRAAVLERAYRAYAEAGDVAAQVRLLDYSGPDFPKLFIQTGGDRDGRLAKLANENRNRADQVVQFLFTSAPEDQVMHAIAARGAAASRTWTNAYASLAGLYLSSQQAEVQHSFELLLGPRTVGAQLASKSGDGSLRAGDWFYYAQRFGEFLGYRRADRVDDYLPAGVEENAAASNNYVMLADSYLDLKNPTAAKKALLDAFEISPDRVDVLDQLAILALGQKQRSEAVADWRSALQLLAARVEQGPLPDTYWQNFRTVLLHGNRYAVTDDLRDAEEQALRAYARRNGNYRFSELLSGWFAEAPDPKTVVSWVISLSRESQLAGLLEEILTARWIPERLKGPLYEESIARSQASLAKSGSNAQSDNRENLNLALHSFALYLEKQKRWDQEWSALSQIEPPQSRNAKSVLLAGAMTGHLDQLLAAYRAKPDTSPSSFEMLMAAQTLEENAKQAEALAVKDFEYSRQLHTGTGGASAWFGLAEVRFAQKRVPEGLQLVRDVTLTVGEPFENLPEAVRVLERNGLTKEASAYAKEWSTAEPWSAEARLESARWSGDANLLNELRVDAGLPYELRQTAATLLREQHKAFPGKTELDLLTQERTEAAAAEQPFFVAARLHAADSASGEERLRLYLEAIAIDPQQRAARLLLAEAAFREKKVPLGMASFDSYVRAQQGSEENPKELRIVRELAGDAAASGGQWGRAATLYSAVLRARLDKTERAAAEQKLTAARHAQQLAAANAQRAPVISSSVSQSRVTKPKLTLWRPDLGKTNETPADTEVAVEEQQEAQ